MKRSIYLLLGIMSVQIYAGEGLARTLYSRLAVPVHHVLTHYRWPSALAGAWANTRMSRWFIKPFVRAYGIDCQEAERDLSGYPTLNSFFSRKLKAGSRPIAAVQEGRGSGVISPGDGGLLVVEHVGAQTRVCIKQFDFNLKQLLQDDILAERFAGGTACIIRLAPNDYHRFHFPVAGVPAAPRIIHGRYESVQPYVFSCGIQPLQINERHVIMLESPTVGSVAMIPVGALFVGSMEYTYTPDQTAQVGDEAGYFLLGGSTVVLLFQPGVLGDIDPVVLANSRQGRETPVRMGQAIAIARSI